MNKYFVFLYFCMLNVLIVAAQNSYGDECSITQFRCDSGECIDGGNLCDGTTECHDSSDETERQCSRLRCPRFTFRCNYGACINRKLRCNGLFDCADGSDESLCGTITPSPSQPASRSCLIPGNPSNGKYAVNDQPVMLQSYFPNLSTLFVNCNERYSNDPPETMYSICRNGAWVPNPPTCSRSCSPLRRRRYHQIRCDYQGKSLESCNNPINGVRAIGECFDNDGPGNNCAYTCTSGSWERISNLYPS